MAKPPTDQFHEPQGHPAVRWGLILLAVLLVVGSVRYLYIAFNGVHGEVVEAPPPQSVNMLPPPPPPPPPPPKPQEATDSAKPVPSEPAAPKQDAPAPMTQNAPAQAGSDSYGMRAGGGGGMGAPGGTGTCVGANCGTGGPAGGISDAFYARTLASALQQRVQADKRVNREVFEADFAVWIGPDGRVTRADIIKGSRDERRDQMLRELLLGASGLTPPPATFKFPRRISVSGKKAI
jgi:pyruvate/2-oxoglutarate dehydrogenase complex dihydrolipoamide acyltransferase (E2) component